MKLSKENFEHLDLPNLLINVWEFNDNLITITMYAITNSMRNGV